VSTAAAVTTTTTAANEDNKWRRTFLARGVDPRADESLGEFPGTFRAETAGELLEHGWR